MNNGVVRWLLPCLLLAGCGGHEATAHQDELTRMGNYCAQAMVASACLVMRGQDVSLVPAAARTVFVAGIGEVDAGLYRDLRAQGEGMCQHLVAQCRTDWDGAPCLTARRLYGGSAVSDPASPVARQVGISRSASSLLLVRR